MYNLWHIKLSLAKRLLKQSNSLCSINVLLTYLKYWQVIQKSVIMSAFVTLMNIEFG